MTHRGGLVRWNSCMNWNDIWILPGGKFLWMSSVSKIPKKKGKRCKKCHKKKKIYISRSFFFSPGVFDSFWWDKITLDLYPRWQHGSVLSQRLTSLWKRYTNLFRHTSLQGLLALCPHQTFLTTGTLGGPGQGGMGLRTAAEEAEIQEPLKVHA